MLTRGLALRISMMVLICFCCMPLLTVLADDEAGSVTFPETGISQVSEETQLGADSSAAVKKQKPQVLVAGSTSSPGEKKDSKVSTDAESAKLQVSETVAPPVVEATMPAETPATAAESTLPQEGEIVIKNATVERTAESPAATEAVAPVEAAAMSSAAQEGSSSQGAVKPQETGKKDDSVKTKGVINKIAVNEPQDEVTQWVWGEVVSVDLVKKQITVKYLDYETYEEALMTLDTDDSTVFDNISGINDIKPADYLTIDYRKLDNVNLSTLIVVEKKDAGVDKKEAEALKKEKADVISSGGMSMAEGELDENIVSSEKADTNEDEALNRVFQEDDLDTLDDITVPLAPPQAEPDITEYEPTPVEDINPEHEQQ